MEMSGKIKLINDLQTFDSGFTKREFVVTTQEQYPQDIKMELVKEKCDLIAPYTVGQDVTVHFDIRGNEYNGRYYVNLRAWRIEGAAQAAPQDAPADNSFPTQPPPVAGGEGEDDLPF